MPALTWCSSRRNLVLRADDGSEILIHPLWLRERCADAKSCDPITRQRLYNPSDLPFEQRIKEIRETASGIHVRFADGANGVFSLADMLRELPGPAYSDLPAPVAWNAATAPPPEFDWHTANTPVSRRKMLEAFLRDGYIVLSNVKCAKGEVVNVARAFGFPRETNFGVLFDVCSIPDAGDLAYTALPLDPHTDNPYRHPVPGIQLLHCLANKPEGGLSTLVDGLAVTEFLRCDDPTAYQILCDIPVRFHFHDSRTDLVAHAPIIARDVTGAFIGLHFSPRLDYVPLLSMDLLNHFYAARHRLDALLRSSRFERRFRLAEGDLIMFDNCRLLHGRTGFDPTTGTRHLQGCYIDSDGPRSLYRALAREQADVCE